MAVIMKNELDEDEVGDDHVKNETGYERTVVALNVKSLPLFTEIMRTKNVCTTGE